MRWFPVALGLVLATGAALVVLAAPNSGQVLSEGFEGREPLWVKAGADATYRETSHRITDDSPHRGQRCEFLQFTAEQGTYIHYSFDVGQAPVNEDLNASVWIKANRPGIQLQARVVLPREPNPGRINEPMTAIIRGEQYTRAGRWQRLDLGQAVKLLREQQQLLRYEQKRDISVADAYVDRLLLNVYGGPGETAIWIDDLEVSPVVSLAPFKTASQERAPGVGATGPVTRPGHGTPLVVLNRKNLLVHQKGFFLRAIRYSDTPPSTLQEAGFNTIWIDQNTPPKTVQEAIRLNLEIVPALPLAGGDGAASSPEAISQTVDRFADEGQVLFWDLGSGGLSAEQWQAVSRLASAVRARDPQRPLAADIRDGFNSYLHDVRLLGVHRWPLMTALDIAQYREWLNQRRSLAKGSFMWTWVQTHLPDWYTSLVYDWPASSGSFTEPIGPQPEQIRLLTYAALSAGYRGLGFWTEGFSQADTVQGHDRLLTMALLNQELQMLEPLLLDSEPVSWIDTAHPDIKAAVLKTDKAVLVLPMWLGSGSQFVPGQGAVGDLSLVLPVPQYMEAWEVTPAEVRRVSKSERVLGGTKITLHEFGLTTAIVCTSDNGPDGLLVNFQKQARKTRKLAAQWTMQLAQEERKKVLLVEEQLEKLGHRQTDGDGLLKKSAQSLDNALKSWNDNNFSEAYFEAQRSLRPLRILMRAQWEDATRDKDLSPAVASPYGVSFFTLPRHWRFVEQIRSSQVGSNVLPNGDFEVPAGQKPPDWLKDEPTLDPVNMMAERVREQPHEGEQCLKLQITAKDPERPPQALESSFLAIYSPAVRLAPGTLVRISAWVRLPTPVTASPDGAMFYDSAGGEPLAVRLTTPSKGWTPLTLYRKVPASGTIWVTMALTGLGTVYFDDVRIEPLLPSAARPQEAWIPPVARVQPVGYKVGR